jgi:hypothetical protein
LADAISKKDSEDMAREMLSVFAKPTLWGMIGTTAWPFPGDTLEWKIGNFIIWAVAGKMLFSTTTKTYVANALRKFSWLEKKEIARYIQTKWSEKLSEPVLNKFVSIQEWLKKSHPNKTVIPNKEDVVKIPLYHKK